jgi:hypothetical protein
VIVVRLVKRSILGVAAGLLVGLAGVAPAYALSPWWHLGVASRPTYLQPGKETDEVWHLTVSATNGNYRLYEYLSGQEFEFEVGEAPEQVQATLEGVYGAGNVQVTGGPGPEHNNPYEVYEIKFVGADSYRHPAPTEVQISSPELSGGRGQAELAVTKGRPAGVIVVSAVNLGDATANPITQPITLTDKLPPGLEAVWIEGYAGEGITRDFVNPLECSLGSLSCTFTGGPPDEQKSLPPYEQMQMRIGVNVVGAKSGEVDEASVVGGGAPAASARQSLTVSDAPISFGVNTYEMRPEEEGGGVDTQAGSHPFQLTTTLMFNELFAFGPDGGRTSYSGLQGAPAALAKDLHFKLPSGLIGNPTPFVRCTLATFLGGEGAGCPPQSIVGVARVTVSVPGILGGSVVPIAVPLFNLDPSVGEPARFGFDVEGSPVLLETALRTGGDYGVTVNVTNITQVAGFISSEVTFWGVPGDPRHDNQRGNECFLAAYYAAHGIVGNAKCPLLEEQNPPPLLALPTSCTGPLHTSMEGDSWREPLNLFAPVSNTAPMPAMDGCNRLQFGPSISVAPDGQAGSAPTGLAVTVHVPQGVSLNPNGLAEAEVKGITVALPEGVAINPAGGDGLEACPEGLIGFEGFRESPVEPGVSNAAFTSKLPEPLEQGLNFCANASKIGTVTIRTPLLPNPLEGNVYLAAQESNPFGSLVAMYIVAKDPVSGSLVKLPGVVHLTETGQVVSTFENDPQLPFEEAELHFFGGDRAPLASPSRCGTYTTRASFAPWTGGEPVNSTSSFEVKSGPNGAACPGASLPFNPSLTAGMTSIQAGGFSPFTMTMSREDGDQTLQSVQLHMPPGLSGELTGVELCPEPQADQGTCGPNSLIGETTVSVGVGGDPFSVKGGKVYLTGPYEGAPFGLSIVNPAKAGPFDLANTKANHPACDCVLVRAKIEVDPITADLTITSDNAGPYKIPTIIEGIPLEIRHVNVDVNRPGFTFNPTNCSPLAITGSLDSTEGASQALSVPFQVTNCAALAFKPKLTASVSGRTSRTSGASFTVKLSYPAGPYDANIAKVKVELPKALPSRLTTLQKACLARVFESNPAACPAASIVGRATASTPELPVPLSGPAYFVSHGGEAFPSLIIVLQGYGVTVHLVGSTFINRQGITSSTFKTVPDAPVGTFELTLPQGPYSALTADTSLCKTKGLAMPTEFTGQNGALINTNTKINVTGCSKAKKTSHKKKRKAKGKRRRKK